MHNDINLTFKAYSDLAKQTDIFTPAISAYVDSLEIPDGVKAAELKDLLGASYVILGLAGEAGEVAGKMKKIIRDGKGKLTDEAREQLLAENGDVTWYNSLLSTKLGRTFASVANNNLNKLFARKDKGTLSGSGDNR